MMAHRPVSLKNTTKSMSRIQEKNRTRILEAALVEFSRFGYSGTTIEKISSVTGMSKSNLLYYFSSKAAIYEAVLANILDIWLAPLKGLNPEKDPAKELAAYIHHKMKMSAEMPDASRLFANEILQGAPRIRKVLEEDLKALIAEKSNVIQQWINQEKIEPIDPVQLIFTIWAMTQHYADFDTQIRLVTGLGLENPGFRISAEETVVRLVLRGIGLQSPDIVLETKP
ncbi:TetR family transcriptional regulator C-terminal domain-containing protein [Roseibium algae]|uniref:TetR family transcriptional regulator C-terminal domain-containing protein n=1 Tax=Roseibium algae TaxID=3123038 RepID=A0ABU8TP03_9HYPH